MRRVGHEVGHRARGRGLLSRSGHRPTTSPTARRGGSVRSRCPTGPRHVARSMRRGGDVVSVPGSTWENKWKAPVDGRRDGRHGFPRVQVGKAGQRCQTGTCLRRASAYRPASQEPGTRFTRPAGRSGPSAFQGPASTIARTPTRRVAARPGRVLRRHRLPSPRPTRRQACWLRRPRRCSSKASPRTCKAGTPTRLRRSRT